VSVRLFQKVYLNFGMSVCFPSVSNGTSVIRQVWLSVHLIQTANVRFCLSVWTSVKTIIWDLACVSVCLFVCFKTPYLRVGLSVCLYVRLIQMAHQIFGMPLCMSVRLYQKRILKFVVSICPSGSNGISEVRHICMSVRLFEKSHLSFGMSAWRFVCFKRPIWGSESLSLCPYVSNSTSEFRHVCLSLCLSVCFKRHIWRSACLTMSVCSKSHIWGSSFPSVCPSICFKRAHLRFGMSVCPCVSNCTSEVRHVCLSVWTSVPNDKSNVLHASVCLSNYFEGTSECR